MNESIEGTYRDCGANACPRVFEVWDEIRGVGDVVAVQGYRFGPGRVPRLAYVPPTEDLVCMSRKQIIGFTAEIASRREPTCFADLLTGWERTLFRLETLQEYRVPQEEDELARWRVEGDNADLPHPNEYHREVAGDAAAGRRRTRVHVVARPLSDYLRWELLAYENNLSAGEDVRIFETANPDAWPGDFYLLDDRITVLVHYDAMGYLLSGWRTDDEDVLKVCRTLRDEALDSAVPLHDFTHGAVR